MVFLPVTAETESEGLAEARRLLNSYTDGTSSVMIHIPGQAMQSNLSLATDPANTFMSREMFDLDSVGVETC